MIIDFSEAPTRGARARIEHEIDRLIGLLDKIDGDLDLEPSLSWPEVGPEGLAPDSSVHDREEEDEHGGDVVDEPHDAIDEGNEEPDLGWRNSGGGDDLAEGCMQPDDCLHVGAELNFDGSGRRLARSLLRSVGSATPQRHPARSSMLRQAAEKAYGDLD